MSSGGSTPTVKKSRGRTARASPTQSATKQRSKKQADPADQQQVQHDDRQRERHPERDDLPTGLAPLLPEGSAVGHATKVGRA